MIANGMNSDRWSELRRVFLDIADLPAARRDAALHDLQQRDPDLASELRRMLACDRQEHTMLDTAAAPLGLLLEPDPAASGDPTHHDSSPLGAGVPEQIGAFRVVSVIGAGASGLILEAEQVSPRRRVAIKLLHPGFASREVRNRFRREAEVLARFSHPGIARVILAGALPAPDGRPYIVLEFIKGQSLVDIAAQPSRSIRDRLLLMAAVCDAVQYAHSRGVIHRDLKPENIVLDGDGQPKVLDFGIARLTDAAEGPSSATLPGELLGTAAYMSPEQAGGSPDPGGEGIDTRADVYALGAITYFLLSGRSPVNVAGYSLAETVSAVHRGEIARLSTLVPDARGDIEAVLHKALARDRRDRYDSASELAAELRRAAEGEPTLVRPPSALRQLRLLARAHPRVVAAATVALLASIGGVAMLERAWAQSEQNFEAASGAADVLLNQVLDRLTPMSGTVDTRRRIVSELQAPVERFAAARPGNPRLTFNIARLLDAQGDLAVHDLKWPDALDLRLRALKILDQLSALPNAPSEWTGLRSLTIVKAGDAYQAMGRGDAALCMYEHALDLDEDLVARSPTDVRLNDQLYWSYQRLAANLYDSDRLRSRAYFQKSRQQADRLLAMSPERPGSLFAKLTVLAEEVRRDEVPESRDALPSTSDDERLAMGRRLVQLSPTNRGHIIRHVRDLVNVAGNLADRGRFEEALALWTQAKSLTEPMLSADPDDAFVLDTQSVVASLGASILQLRGDQDSAAAMLNESLRACLNALSLMKTADIHIPEHTQRHLQTLMDRFFEIGDAQACERIVVELTDVARNFWRTNESPIFIETLASTCNAPLLEAGFGPNHLRKLAAEIDAGRPGSAVPALLRAEAAEAEGDAIAAAEFWSMVMDRRDECGRFARTRLVER